MRYHNITKDDMLNGDGLRVVLWVAGCNHHCRECHNPVTWDPESGLVFDEDAKQEIFEQLEKSYISGLTLSGGDPLYPANLAEIEKLARQVKGKYPQKTIWLYTGSIWEEIQKLSILQYVDVCVDGEFLIEERDPKLLWKGSKNQRVIDVKATLAQKDKSKPVLHSTDYERDYDMELADRKKRRTECEG
ncbi:MAG: anaerobic ribonucleoside-triphosphate reductase activating protein [Lachnospiraceae bacterium]|nr:anaerobic ribonucleoside-triphosphate reductase activating protein [Lachnospiraceae bacterium]